MGMKLTKIALAVAVGFGFLAGRAPAAKKLYVVTSNTSLADFVRQVGGARVEVESLARGTQDLHYVEPRPSFVSKLREADLVVLNGLAFDIWMAPLLDAARNPSVAVGGRGYVDASAGVRALEVPSGKVSMAQGELHPLGNPHFLGDPRNAKVAVRNILAGLIRISPGDSGYFKANAKQYLAQLSRKIEEWKKIISPFRGQPVVTYHKSWTYFIKGFGLTEFGTVEPKPAIPPSPLHVDQLMKSMREHHVKVIMKEPYFPDKFPQIIAREVNGKLLVLPEWAGGAPGTDTYIALMDYLVNKVAEALK